MFRTHFIFSVVERLTVSKAWYGKRMDSCFYTNDWNKANLSGRETNLKYRHLPVSSFVGWWKAWRSHRRKQFKRWNLPSMWHDTCAIRRIFRAEKTLCNTVFWAIQKTTITRSKLDIMRLFNCNLYPSFQKACQKHCFKSLTCCYNHRQYDEAWNEWYSLF